MTSQTTIVDAPCCCTPAGTGGCGCCAGDIWPTSWQVDIVNFMGTGECCDLHNGTFIVNDVTSTATGLCTTTENDPYPTGCCNIDELFVQISCPSPPTTYTLVVQGGSQIGCGFWGSITSGIAKPNCTAFDYTFSGLSTPRTLFDNWDSALPADHCSVESGTMRVQAI